MPRPPNRSARAPGREARQLWSSSVPGRAQIKEISACRDKNYRHNADLYDLQTDVTDAIQTDFTDDLTGDLQTALKADLTQPKVKKVTGQKSCRALAL